jgi:hypothetical protein
VKLLRSFSGGKAPTGEDRIGGGFFGLPDDPVLHSGEAFGRLMDVVAVGDVGESFEQLLEAFASVQGRSAIGVSVADRAARRSHGRENFFDVLHPRAFPYGIRASILKLSLAS